MSPAEARKAWTAALRSGEYEQTTGHLADEHGYCCLGVACEVAIAHGLDLDVQDVGGALVAYNGLTQDLPDRVKEWLGLAFPDGLAKHGESLAWMNDNGWSFIQIADVIDSEPDGLLEAGA